MNKTGRIRKQGKGVISREGDGRLSIYTRGKGHDNEALEAEEGTCLTGGKMQKYTDLTYIQATK